MPQQSSQPTFGQQTATPQVNQTIQPYYVGGGQAGLDYSKMIGQGWNQMQQYGGQVQQFGQESMAPHFQDMFQKYVDVTNQAANQQAGQIGETMGSRGALYSSANLNAQAALRERTSTDLASKAAEYQQNLEQLRQGAQNVYQQGQGIYQQGQTGLLGAQAGVATAELGSREAAMARAYQDYMKQSSVPPFASVGVQWGANQPGAGSYAH